MLENQLGRRNLNDFCKAEIVLRNKDLIAEIAEKAKESQLSGLKKGSESPLRTIVQNGEPVNQRKVMADITHTSEGNRFLP
jgi:hypothetical protein